jgi:hypothetical protein
MTAPQIIEYAHSLNTNSTLLELGRARRLLNSMEDVITSPELVEAWGHASEHINDTLADQDRLAKYGKRLTTAEHINYSQGDNAYGKAR